MKTSPSRQRAPHRRAELEREPMALAADWLQVCQRIKHVVARQRLLIHERLAALKDRRAAVPTARDSSR